MLVAMAVFSMLVVVLLSLTGSILSNATRVDESTEANRDVRVFFDLLRRDLAQARISTTNRNFFIGSSNEISFTASSSKLRTNNISDARLIAYRFVPADRVVYRAEVAPTIENLNSNVWQPTNLTWTSALIPPSTNSDGQANYFWEPVLSGVISYGDSVHFFTGKRRQNGALYYFTDPNAAQITNPPSGIQVAFRLLNKQARARKVTEPDLKDADFRKFKYDIELNLPPAYNP
jgi:type II secretory pathway pseudopilin PulG